MHDPVIRGGTVIDGTGAARYLADVAVEFTGQLPGRLVRGSKPAPLAQAPGCR